MPPMQSTPNTVPPHFSRFLSETVEITAESGQKRFSVHSAILAAQAGSLRPPTTGEGANKIDLSAWDGDTVGRLVQFLYVGNYEFPGQTTGEGEDDENDQEMDGGVGIPGRAVAPDSTQSLAEKEANGDTNVLLIHARVYALAQNKGLGELQKMALRRLRAALEARDIHWPVPLEFLELLDYVYSNTESYVSCLMNPREPMRDLVSTLAAENFDKMVGPEMAVLLTTRGGLAVELLEKVTEGITGTGDLREAVKRLHDLEGEVQAWKDRALSDERVRELEVIYSGKVQQLEREIRRLEAANAEMQQSEAASSEKMKHFEVKLLHLGATNANILQQLVISKEKIRKSKDSNERGIMKWKAAYKQNLEEVKADYQEKVRILRSLNEEKADLLEEVTTELEVVKRLNDAKSEKIELLETKVKWYEAAAARQGWETPQ